MNVMPNPFPLPHPGALRYQRRALAMVPLALALLALAIPASGRGTEEAPGASAISPAFRPITELLALPPAPIPLPAFGDREPGSYGADERLAHATLNLTGLRPRDGAAQQRPDGTTSTWRRTSSADGTYAATPTDPARAQEAYFALYLTADRWQEAVVAATAAHPSRIYLDGAGQELEAVSGAEAEDASAGDDTERRATMKLTPGQHVVMVRTIYDPEIDEPWTVTLRIGLATELPAAALLAGVDSRRAVDIHDILDAPRVTTAALSSDGELAALVLAAFPAGNDERETWLELRRVAGGEAVASWRGLGEVTQVRFAPGPQRWLSYVTRKEDRSTLWLADLDRGENRALVRDIEEMGAYRWSPDGRFVVFEIGEKPEADERRVKRVREPADRQPGWRNRTHLVQASVPEGARRRLTAGPVRPEDWRVSPDGERILFFVSEPDLTERPYFSSELWELNLETLAAQRLLADRWISGAAYAPDGHRLALRGSPSAFDGLGLNLPQGVRPNDYGGQLYLYDPQSGKATPLSRDFDPDIATVEWSAADGLIYALCTDRQQRNLYTLDPNGDRIWRHVVTGFEYTDGLALAERAPVAVAWGTSAATPPRLHRVDLRRGEVGLLADPGAERYRDVALARVEDWPCTLPDGEVLDGRIYYPSDFDPARRYPVIVYYYGGTVPVTRDFGGRYPKNVWAGRGYVVYVPEPSGATGYGQSFAARHVNDWGRRTAWEVIEGTRAFLAAHAFADPQRVGCIGASYGGFLTEYILTRTDLYAGAVSHAGISSIASYWGEGLWGYAYGARALANAFPWQDRDLYVEQSPLFHADKITTPLLLLHGDSDTNVPVGESDQLFTALKLLGREVEYVQILGQNHHILDHEQRIVWNDTILAWFARCLKDRPQWWEQLYPDPGAED